MKTDKKQARWRRLIRRAANFMKKHEWNIGCLARESKPINNVGDIYLPVFHPKANCFCMLGAMCKVSKEVGNKKFGEHGKLISSFLYSLNHKESRDQFIDKDLVKAIEEIAKYHGRTPQNVYYVNDSSSRKEEVIQKMLMAANQ